MDSEAVSVQPQGWIDDPDDPWVGFVVDRLRGCEPPGTNYALHERMMQKLPVFVRVRPVLQRSQRTDLFTCGPLIYQVHPDDVDRLRGDKTITRRFVCPHMGRFVE